MKPTLLSFPHVGSYPALMLLGFIFGWVVARHRARFFGVQPAHIDTLCLILPISGMVGARFFARLFYAKLPLLEALKVWEGDGLVFYGGFVFSVAAVTAYALWRRIKLLALYDCLAPSVALGLAFGRVGCFLGGCCWGDVCTEPSALARLDAATISQICTVRPLSSSAWPLAVEFPAKSDPYKQHVKLGVISADANLSLPVHPVQLYEALLAAALCVFVHLRFRGEHQPGNAALALLSGYAVIRFLTEFLRADNKIYAMNLTFSQVVSIVLLLVCVAAAMSRALFRKSPLPEPAVESTESVLS